MLETAIVSFLPDQISIPLQADIRRSLLRCEPLSIEAIQRIALRAEAVRRPKLAAPLTYGRFVNSAPPVAIYHEFSRLQLAAPMHE
jgi:hypothetical protein